MGVIFSKQHDFINFIENMFLECVLVSGNRKKNNKNIIFLEKKIITFLYVFELEQLTNFQLFEILKYNIILHFKI